MMIACRVCDTKFARLGSLLNHAEKFHKFSPVRYLKLFKPEKEIEEQAGNDTVDIASSDDENQVEIKSENVMLMTKVVKPVRKKITN